MSERGKILEPGTVRLERLLPGPIERVWLYLTDSEKRGTWLASGEMQPLVGGKIELNFHHTELSTEPTPEKYKNCGGSLSGRVTQFDPPRLLSYTWSGEPGEESEVTFELQPRDEKVLLRLTHRRLGDRKAMVSVAGGWDSHLAILEDQLSGQTPRPFWTMLDKVAAEYEELVPAGTAGVRR